MQANTGYQIILSNEKNIWNNCIQNSVTHDFYHTWGYHQLEQSGKPFLFLYNHNDQYIAFPLIKRAIPQSFYADCTSVYGYPGPISNVRFNSLSHQTITGFKCSFNEFLQNEKIVSVFSRLNPFIGQHRLLKEFDGQISTAKTVVVDLSLSDEARQSRYRRSTRQRINQLRKMGFIIKEADTEDEILAFAKVYTENMARVNASKYYFFDKSYFLDFLTTPEFKSKLLLAYANKDIVAGGIITMSNSIAQMHLAATATKYLTFAPLKLLFDEACILLKARGMSFLNLGGGIGGREDSLYQFKSGFSNLTYLSGTWQYIADITEYERLTHITNTNHTNNCRFPVYRCQ